MDPTLVGTNLGSGLQTHAFRVKLFVCLNPQHAVNTTKGAEPPAPPLQEIGGLHATPTGD